MNSASPVYASAHRLTPPEGQRGTVLLITLIMLIAMSLSGVGLVRTVDTTALIAGNMAFKQGTLMATDIGVEAASQTLKDLVIAGTTETDDAARNYSASYSQELASPVHLTGSTANAIENVNNTGNTVRYWMERMCVASGLATATGCIREAGRDTPYYRVTTRVEGPRGTIAVTQSTIQTPGQFVPQHAILTERKLNMSSTITVSGAGGNVHSNSRVELSGTTVLTLASGTVSAVGRHASSGGTQGVYNSGSFTGGITEDAPMIDIPEFNPTNFERYADFKLHKDGKVTNRMGDVLMTAAEGQAGVKWLGWKYSAPSGGAAAAIAEPGTPPTLENSNKLATWELLDDVSWSSGLLYVEGHAYVSSSPGTTGVAAKGPSPWLVSIAATGNIRINNAKIQDYRDETLLKWAHKPAPPPAIPPPTPYDNPTSPAIPAWPTKAAVPESIRNLFLVAGLDLKFDGTVEQVGPDGLMTAREQMAIMGVSSLRGSIIASDKYGVSPLLTQNQVSGNTTIAYSGNLSTPAVQGVSRRVSWRAIQQ